MNLTELTTGHGPLPLPTFLPDATRGVLKAVDASDVANAGISAMMVNALHLATTPGITTVTAAKGIHNFMGWSGPLASDSGGFQVLSLVESGLGSVGNKGFKYRVEKGAKTENLTPEKCIQNQFRIGADIFFTLDQCTRPEADAAEQRVSVDRTIAWGRRCSELFRDRVNMDDPTRPRLFAVIQGGADPDLRRRCADALFEIGFDGYGFGGWPIGEDGQLIDMVATVAGWVPDGLPIHALGIGKPENVVTAFRAGYTMFDCVLPTRDARRKRLAVFRDGDNRPLDEAGTFYKYLYLQDDKHRKNAAPLDATCDCHTCQTISRAYLHHLYRADEAVANRLATIHNLRFVSRLMERLRQEAQETEEAANV